MIKIKELVLDEDLKAVGSKQVGSGIGYKVFWTEGRKGMTVRLTRCTQMDNMTNFFVMNCDNLNVR